MALKRLMSTWPFDAQNQWAQNEKKPDMSLQAVKLKTKESRFRLELLPNSAKELRENRL